MRPLTAPEAPLFGLLLASLAAAGGESPGPQGRLERWARAGFQYVKLELCRRAATLSEAECRRLSRLQLSGVAVYVSEPGRSAGGSEKVVAILPDSPGTPQSQAGHGAPRGLQGSFPGSTAHDAVMVLDPSPGENFGHSLLLFYVDANVTKKRCAHLDGMYLGQECLSLAPNSHCQNQLKRRHAGPEHFLGNGRFLGNGWWRSGGVALRRGVFSGPISSPISGSIRGHIPTSVPVTRSVSAPVSAPVSRSGNLCEVHFLPLVVGVKDSNRTQRLRCVDHPEFARCPLALPTIPSMPLGSCELHRNTRRCHQQPLASYLSCRLYQTCDHALLLSGGWQQIMTYQLHVENLQMFYRMLRTNGFHKDNIKTFFAGSGQLPEEVEGVYPATEKIVIRNHVAYVCRKQHCADSLVLYLNSPTRSDGTMLLWDGNLNGIADLKERYSVSELLADLAGCRARRVLLFVEQSHNWLLAKRLGASTKHPNVALLPGPPWRAGSWAGLGPHTCLLDHLGQGPNISRLLEPWAGLLNVTLAGAPCQATPPLSEGERRREYHGCQNLPTALWHRRHN